ncbi:Post-GPI attachment to proteins 5 [Carabus blaptoides fortunei]
MRTLKHIIYKSLGYLLLLLCFCEYLFYYLVLWNCDWPALDPQNADPRIPYANEEPVKVMVLADTHLLGSRNGHWFDKLRREWQMRRAFQTALTLHQPELVFILGDITDEGLWCSDTEFQTYVDRFHQLFAVPEATKLYVVVGNHDIGFHYGISPYLNQRFVSAFDAPAVKLVSVRGNHFVLVNSMALEGDGCFLCKPAKQELVHIENRLKCTEGVRKCGPNMKLDRYSKPILMQHYPLYRESDALCNEPDAAPASIKAEPFRERWECISREATYQLLDTLRPRLAMSGHTHHGCKRQLPQGGEEITVPSFSWRNKDNPNYALGVFTPDNYAISRCEMPRESTVIMLYILGSLVFALYLSYEYRRTLHRCMFKVQ